MDKFEFIQKAKEVHGDAYDYHLLPDGQIKTKQKVEIICPEHGVFLKDFQHHVYRSAGCPECVGKKRYTIEEFIDKCKKLPHTENFTYEDTVYVNTHTKIKVKCHHKDENGREHGTFEITPLHLLGGEGCPICRYVKSSAGRRRSLKQVIEKAQQVHGNKYDYSLISEYKNDRIKYPIICKKHGVFYQTLNNHIMGEQGCPICGRISNGENRRSTTEEFIEKAKLLHGDKYDYSKVNYVTNSIKVCITCPKHGDFLMEPGNHLMGQGCPKCGAYQSKGETEIFNFIKEILPNNEVIQREHGIIGGEELDIYIPSLKIAFEYNGLYWHSEISKDSRYHLRKTKKCEENGIRLFHVFEDDWIYRKDIVKSMIKNILGKTENKIYARKCIIKEVNFAESKDFLNKNHIQGYCPSKVRYGLYYNNELVSLMTFGASRHFVGNGKHEWELLRFCSKINLSVIGGASKIFNFFIRQNNPNEIISYADKSRSVGKLYTTLGFTKYNESVPNYYYIINGKRIYRFNMRKSILVKKYGCPPEMSEKEFCYSQKWYRIYDCGSLCYIWKNKND